VTNKKHTYLITGGCGFIGSCLIRNLAKKNNYLINIDKISYASNEKSVGNVNKSNYLLIKKDIRDPIFLKNVFNKYKPNYVIHLAAESHVDRSIDRPEDFIFTNIVGTYNLLNSAYDYWNKTNRDKNFRFLYVSTDEVYGSLKSKDKSFKENSLIKPNSPYAASKASGDLLAYSWFKTYGLPIVMTNSSNNYGIWQFPEKLIPLVIQKCLRNKNIPIYGKGKQIRDWINVEDHVDGIIKVLAKGISGEKYNIGANNEISNLDLVKLICSLMDKLKPKSDGKYSNLITFVEDRPGHDFRYSLDTRKINRQLSWKARINFKKGLNETIKWYLSNKDWLNSIEESKYDGKRLGRLRK